MTETQIILIAGRKENERGRIRLSLDNPPRMGELIHHKSAVYEVQSVAWDFEASPPVCSIHANLSFRDV